jgi:hypothetical protein
MMWLEVGGISWIFGKKTGYKVIGLIAQCPSLWFILTYLGGYDELFNNVDLCSVVRAGYVHW